MTRLLTALILGCLALTTAAPARAATANRTIALKGTVVTACTVDVTDLGVALDVVTGETKRQVGSVVENCNDGKGYTISVNSANNGKLKSGTNTVAFTPFYDGTTGNGSGSVSVTRSKATFAKTASLAVTIPANAKTIAGSYSDTLTITIKAK
ncbi:spore coat protein U domain-containing protein [Nitrospirillum sp. BR 11828]|uniref:spore coat protein U domain-containing protein n=1 Tax=Nitrospirillum sp. BR 11828 TaxID=3104325 RepID=UPI002ACACF29|nr:spore coat protein U domain-containing protein [Nitrospirillum sp. BR 11828]MDZ5650522.1 spore coat protein U domain-containing protein [Nitrospirillum sp. BR 11828]